MVWAALDRGAESRGWWGLCHSPSRVIGSRCEAAWPLRQKGVRAALKAQRRADGIAGTQTNPCSQPKKNRIPHCAADHWASIGALPYSSTSGRYMPSWQTTTKLFLVKLPLFIYKTLLFHSWPWFQSWKHTALLQRCIVSRGLYRDCNLGVKFIF